MEYPSAPWRLSIRRAHTASDNGSGGTENRILFLQAVQDYRADRGMEYTLFLLR